MEHLQSQDTSLSPTSPVSPRGGAPANQSSTSIYDDWKRLADATEIVEAGLKEVYVSALEVSKYETAELLDVHTLADKVQQTLGPQSPKVKAIMRDMKQLEESLPIHPDSAIFVRQVRRMGERERQREGEEGGGGGGGGERERERERERE